MAKSFKKVAKTKKSKDVLAAIDEIKLQLGELTDEDSEDVDEDRVDDAAVALVARKKGNKDQAIQVALTDAYQARRRARLAEQALRDAPELVEGGKLLTADEAKAYDAYVALGKPEDVKKSIEDGTANKTKLDELETKAKESEGLSVTKSYAEALKWNPDILADRLKADGNPPIELKAIKNPQGVLENVYHVKTKDGTLQPLTEYANTNWLPYLPALTAVVAPVSVQNQQQQQQQQQQQNFTPFIPQGTPGQPGGGGGNVAENFLKNLNAENDSRSNPLRPAPATK